MRNKVSKQTTSLVGTSHIRDKTKDIRINISPAPPRKPTISQKQPTQPVKLKDLPPSTKSPRDQAQHGQPTSHPTEEQADAPSPAKGNRPLPINITLQDSKDTVALIQDTLKIGNFHIKRIHVSKHVLYLQNLNDYNKRKEILITTDTAFYTYTPKSQKQHTYLLKGLDNSVTETEILDDLKAL
jgi:hypothetical protein